MAAASNGRKTTPAPARRSNAAAKKPAARRRTTQTIEQIEARAAAINEAERDSLRRLAAFLRDQAVELPVESELPLKYAKAAKSLDMFVGSPSGFGPVLGFNCGVEGMIRDLKPVYERRRDRAEVAGLECLQRTIREVLAVVPEDSCTAQAFGEMPDHIQARLDVLRPCEGA